jgi:hypothetical protein
MPEEGSCGQRIKAAPSSGTSTAQGIARSAAGDAR